MSSLLIEYKFNILLMFLLFLFLLVVLFPSFWERILSNVLKIKIKKEHIFLTLLLIILTTLFAVSKLDLIITLPMIIFSSFVFLLGFLSNREYIYSLALISLALTPVMLIFKLDSIADFFAQVCYLLLVLGVLKDIFYGKIFD